MAIDELNQFNWTEAELFTYEQEMKRIMDNRAIDEYNLKKAEEKGIQMGKEEGIQIGTEQGMQIGTEQGIQIGREKGKAEAMKAVAKIMLMKHPYRGNH